MLDRDFRTTVIYQDELKATDERRRHVPVPEDAAVTGDDLWSDKDGPGGWAVATGVMAPGLPTANVIPGGTSSGASAPKFDIDRLTSGGSTLMPIDRQSLR